MPVIRGGDRILLPSPPGGAPPMPGTAGCLVQFPDRPSRILLLTAGHVVVRKQARQYDPIQATDGSLIGRLWSWTGFAGDTTCDAALVWVDPRLVSPVIVGRNAPPAGFNSAPQPNMQLSIFAQDGTARATKFLRMDDIDVAPVGPDWSVPQPVTYHNQMLCQPVTEGGDSGSVALDGDGKIVGLVVAGEKGAPYTVVTPIEAILGNAAWRGARLAVLDAIPATAVAPPPQPVDLSAIPAQRQPVAQQILDGFNQAGFGLPQQVAALANAMAESSLNPMALSRPPEDSVGLFQLNRTNGEGRGYTVAQLQDAGTNIAIAVAAAHLIQAFTSATTLDAAVDAFVRHFERPADVDNEVTNRLHIARGLLLT